MSKTRRETCETCAFWVQEHLSDPQGQCRRYPPPEAGYNYPRWPYTASADWCDEWHPAGGDQR